jgi:LPXTG-motif cell wall-anchored protein
VGPSATSLDCRRVPSVCRRIVVLLVVALMGVGGVGGSVSPVYAQGAGDQQYEDPLGSSEDSGSSDDNLEPLSPSPQTSGSDSSSSSGATSGTSGTADTSATGTTTSSATAATLPNTGLDTRVLVLAGAVLLLVGVGLRMRNAPERF